jgi:hypothetical protein
VWRDSARARPIRYLPVNMMEAIFDEISCDIHGHLSAILLTVC